MSEIENITTWHGYWESFYQTCLLWFILNHKTTRLPHHGPVCHEITMTMPPPQQGTFRKNVLNYHADIWCMDPPWVTRVAQMHTSWTAHSRTQVKLIQNCHSGNLFSPCNVLWISFALSGLQLMLLGKKLLKQCCQCITLYVWSSPVSYV